MNLQTSSIQITVQQEFVYQSAGLIHKVGGVTLDGTKFTGLVKAGTVVAVGQENNPLAEPWNSEAVVKGTVYVTTNDVKIVGTQNVQVGALEEGYLNRKRVTGVASEKEAAFAEQSQNRFKLRG